jgi:hypothetical protein
VIEKCEAAIKQMHRPMVFSETAAHAKITAQVNHRNFSIGRYLDLETYEYIAFTEESDNTSEIVGRISSYNMNTFKGRIYTATQNRPIPFELAEGAKTRGNINLITESLMRNSQDRQDPRGEIRCQVYRFSSRSDRLKKVLITKVSK